MFILYRKTIQKQIFNRVRQPLNKQIKITEHTLIPLKHRYYAKHRLTWRKMKIKHDNREIRKRFTLSPGFIFSGTGTTFPEPKMRKKCTLWCATTGAVGRWLAASFGTARLWLDVAWGMEGGAFWLVVAWGDAFRLGVAWDGPFWLDDALMCCTGIGVTSSLAIRSKSFFLWRQCFSYRIPKRTIKYSSRERKTKRVHEMIHTSMHFSSNALGELFLKHAKVYFALKS